MLAALAAVATASPTKNLEPSAVANGRVVPGDAFERSRRNVFGETAPSNATCKNGYSKFSEPAAQIVGCYKLFTSRKNWEEARAACRSQAGELAAARTVEENEFIIRQGSTANFNEAIYTSGNSKDSASWNFGRPYYHAPDFFLGGSQISSTVPTAEHPYLDHVLVTGLQRAFKWDLVEGTAERLYACRKRACGPVSDVLDGLCSTDAYSAISEGDNQDWIVAPIVSAVVVTGALLVYMWYDKQKLDAERLGNPDPNPRRSAEIEQMRKDSDTMLAGLPRIKAPNRVAPETPATASPMQRRRTEDARPGLPTPAARALPGDGQLPKLKRGSGSVSGLTAAPAGARSVTQVG